MQRLRLDIDSSDFTQHVVTSLTRGGISFPGALTNAVKANLSQHLDQLIASGACIGYVIKNGGQSQIVSLDDAIDRGGFDFWYLDIQLDLAPGTVLSEHDVSPPSAMQWLPIDYGSGVKKTLKFKHKTMKTRERYEIQLLHPHVSANLLNPVRQQFATPCACAPDHLVPFSAPVYEWQQAFGCVVCGTRYICECFRTAIEKSQKSEKTNRAPFRVRYRPNLCHLCTGRPSDLFFCAPMYGSAIKVRYGAYIEKFAIEEDISARDAENKVRDILGVPRIGEGWINETQLFKLVKLLFADYEVLREARLDWLGSQRIDIFIPALSVAIEYQGEQHFRPVALFGGEDGFRAAQLRDKRKRRLCKENGLKLIYFAHTEDLSVERVEKKLKPYLQAALSPA